MALAKRERTAGLVIRAWLKDDSATGLRARITSTLDLSSDGEIVTVACTGAEVSAAVDSWLQAFLGN